jgi:hypothetical protein
MSAIFQHGSKTGARLGPYRAYRAVENGRVRFGARNLSSDRLPEGILQSIEGSGFGIISKTAGNSRQIQFSLKLIY